ncbi:MAG: hypothetical protein JWO52_4115 [Gammaproteobacteria bacterium]|nr:hypothetical protein [Gammaproteobacteria bacterium]
MVSSEDAYYEPQEAKTPVPRAPTIPPYCLEVGLSMDEREVIINHPELTPNPDGSGGHIVFSPQQARDLAKLLLQKAKECKS